MSKPESKIAVELSETNNLEEILSNISITADEDGNLKVQPEQEQEQEQEQELNLDQVDFQDEQQPSSSSSSKSPKQYKKLFKNIKPPPSSSSSLTKVKSPKPPKSKQVHLTPEVYQTIIAAVRRDHGDQAADELDGKREIVEQYLTAVGLKDLVEGKKGLGRGNRKDIAFVYLPILPAGVPLIPN
jgi:hypothetical protein